MFHVKFFGVSLAALGPRPTRCARGAVPLFPRPAFPPDSDLAVKQTLAKGLNIPMATAEKQVLSTNFSTTFNTASIGLIESDTRPRLAWTNLD